MRTRYKIHSKGPEYPYFVTSTIVAWIPVFTHKDHFEIVASSLEYCRKEKGMRLYAYVIMENHIHLIASSPDLSKTMQSLKSFTAKRLIESITQKKMMWLLNQRAYHKAGHKKDSEYQVWQEGFHPEEIGSPEMFRQKAAYLHYNPVRRGYVTRPEHWQRRDARRAYLPRLLPNRWTAAKPKRVSPFCQGCSQYYTTHDQGRISCPPMFRR